MVKAFAANEDVAFGDVNLSEAQVPGDHSPGMGGWPTIRYFNQKTGVAGGSYKQKTNKAMCEELGDDENMTNYVEDFGKTSLCNAITKAGCSEKEISYIDKMSVKPKEDIEAQLKRLNGMEPTKMKDELASWLDKRKKILTGLLSSSADSDEL